MIERAIEHWLTSTNERGYEIPYCQVLLTQGYSVLHLSSHGPMEQGKDVIALTPEGQPCAFQLKAGDITKTVWRAIHPEIAELAELPIRFPGIPKGQHRSVLVTNGALSETARCDLSAFNEGLASRGIPSVEVITRGRLLNEFVEAQGSFLPTELPGYHRFLELLLRDGRDTLPKAQLSALIESVLLSSWKRPQTDVPRAIASVLLLVGYVLGNQYAVGNHVAALEGWTIAAAYVMAMADRHSLPRESWEPSFILAMRGAQLAADELRHEVATRPHFVETHDIIYDGVVYGARLTVVFGYLAAAALSLSVGGATDWTDPNFDEVIRRHTGHLDLFGESAVPFMYFLARYAGTRIAGLSDDLLIREILDTIVARNGPDAQDRGLPDTYHDLESCLRLRAGLDDPATSEDFTGTSHTLRPLLDFLVVRCWRQTLASRWDKISQIQTEEFVPDEPWQTYRWHNEDAGEVRARFPSQRQSWKDLMEEAGSVDLGQIPASLRLHPEVLPYFLCVYPHRFRPALIRYMESLLR